MRSAIVLAVASLLVSCASAQLPEAKLTGFSELEGKWVGVLDHRVAGRSGLTLQMRPDGTYDWYGSIVTKGQMYFEGSSVRYRNDAGSTGLATYHEVGDIRILRFHRDGGDYTVEVKYSR